MKRIKEISFLLSWLIAGTMGYSQTNSELVNLKKENKEPSRVYILGYHNFSTNTNSDLTFSLEELQGHIELFKKEGFNFISFSDITNNNVQGTKNIMISIDDGYKSVSNAYYQVFKTNNIKPLLGIPAILLYNKQKKSIWLNESSLKTLLQDGCELSVHGYRHEYHTPSFYKNKPATYSNELYKPKCLFEKKYKLNPSSFIYPGGHYLKKSHKHLKKANYKYAFTINWGGVNLPLPISKRAYYLPRYVMNRKSSKMICSIILRKEKTTILASK